mgnify:CR=1 FL=1
MNKIKKETAKKQELIQKWANASQTYANCHGYYKGEQNASLIARYEKELDENYDYKPTWTDAELGRMNGIGAW